MTLFFKGGLFFALAFFSGLTVLGQSLLYPGHYYYNRILAAKQWYPQLRGDQLNIAIKDENIDTTLLDIRNKVLYQEGLVSKKGIHATQLACLVVGSGVTEYHPLGLSPGSSVFNTSFSKLLPDALRMKEWRVSAHLFSYGTDIENYYGLEAALYDAAAVSDTSLLYIFSSGNSGFAKAVGGRYDQLLGWSNLTGNFKQSKNSLVVGATGMNNELMSFSSKGPAYDGRIKPEITAHSENGTSESAAVVAGSVLLLQDLYRQKFGTLPSSALLRSVLLTAAMKTKGSLSHASGFGSLDLFRSLKVIEKQQFVHGTVASSDSFLCRIKVPPLSRNLTITLSWIDPPAKAGERKALVNDLDLRGYIQKNQSWWLPNVLHTDSDPLMLKSNAQQGVDHLNNNEQIFIPEPVDTIVEIKVIANVTKDRRNQNFYISYVFDESTQLEWLTPVSTHLSYDSTGIFVSWIGDPETKRQLFSEDTAGIRTLIRSQITGNMLFWKPQQPITQKIRFRLQEANHEVVSPWLNIYPKPQIQIVSVCKDSLFVEWDLPTQKRVTWIGDVMKDPWVPVIGHLRTTSHYTWISMRDLAEQPLWVVMPVNDRLYEKSSQIRAEMDLGMGCLTESFSAMPGIDKVSLLLKLSTITSIDSVQIQQKKPVGWKNLYSGKVKSEVLFVDDTQPHQGMNYYRVVVYSKNRSPLYGANTEAFFFGKKAELFYPNPIRSGAPLSFVLKEPGKRNISLLDINGRILYSLSIDVASGQIRLPILKAGTYLIRITNGINTITEPLLVQ